jgi:hypothetical protein
MKGGYSLGQSEHSAFPGGWGTRIGKRKKEIRWKRRKEGKKKRKEPRRL